MKKKAFALAGMAAIVAAAAMTTTGAYLTHKTEDKANVITVGQLQVNLTEPEYDGLPDAEKVLYPGREVAKDPTACNLDESSAAAYMYLEVQIPTAEVRTYTVTGEGTSTLDNGGLPHLIDLVSYQTNAGWSILADGGTQPHGHTITYAYKDPIAPGENTPPLFSSVTYANVVEGDISQGSTAEILCGLTAIQSDYVAGATTAAEVWQAVMGGETP